MSRGSGSDHRIAVGDGISLFCGDHAGPAPVLCLPGLTRNSRDFGPLAQHLSSGRRVLTPDLRGRGRSDRDPDWRHYRLDMYVADMIALLDHLDIEKVVVIGTSLGGLVGMFMAAWVVSSLCMCGSVPAGLRRGGGTVMCGQNNVVHVKWFLPTRSIIGWNVLRICRASARGPKAVFWLAVVARQRCATQPFYLKRRKVV